MRSNPCKSLMEPIERELMVPWNDLVTFQNLYWISHWRIYISSKTVQQIVIVLCIPLFLVVTPLNRAFWSVLGFGEEFVSFVHSFPQRRVHP